MKEKKYKTTIINNLREFSRDSISDSRLLELLYRYLSLKVILIDLINFEQVLSTIKNLRNILNIT
jgi:hypothetical protein